MNRRLPWGVGSPRELRKSASGKKPAGQQKSQPPPHSSSKPAFSSVYLFPAAAVQMALSLVLLTWPQHHVGDAGRDAEMRTNQNRAMCLSSFVYPCLLFAYFGHHCCCDLNRALHLSVNRSGGWKSWQIYVNLKCFFYSQIYRLWSADIPSHAELSNPRILLTSEAKPSEVWSFVSSISGVFPVFWETGKGWTQFHAQA